MQVTLNDNNKNLLGVKISDLLFRIKVLKRSIWFYQNIYLFTLTGIVSR